jgi:hypothetical protein
MLVFHADCFNVLNHANRNDPFSDTSISDFGRIVALSSGTRFVPILPDVWLLIVQAH